MGYTSSMKSKPSSKMPKRETWRLEDLPADQQAELLDRYAQAERGEDLQDFDEAIKEADDMADKILSLIGHDEPRRRSA